jgi:hypothetical protein
VDAAGRARLAGILAPGVGHEQARLAGSYEHADVAKAAALREDPIRQSDNLIQ